MKRILFIPLVLASLAGMSNAQSDSLADVFPLAVGNSWTYRYYTISERNSSSGLETVVDSGRAQYRILAAHAAADSVRWIFRRVRDILHRYSLNNYDTSYSVTDTSVFVIIEKLSGRHHLYRDTAWYFVAKDVFAFTREHTDTTAIYRYWRIGTGDTTTFRSAVPSVPPNPLYISNYTFQRARGLTRLRYNDGRLDAYSASHHYLTESILTEVKTPRTASIPQAHVLHQNFPNPFNPATVIRFEVGGPNSSAGQTAFVTLKVFDMLGREVATLVNEEKEHGTHTVRWNADGHAGGTYIFQLRIGAYHATKKMVLLH